jgi:uncharacterized protein with HEPN domain/predicted nucleotidyltransferase
VCTENFNKNSDIDLLISFKPMDYGDYADTYFELTEEFEKILNRPVDLVTDKSLGNPYFIESLNKTKTPIYEAWSKKYLFDIKESIDSIENYLGEKRDFSVYVSNKMLRRAIEREFEIIGEAMNRIEKVDSSINISSKKQIISMRNRVIHGYDKIDNEIVWGTIVRHLPKLKEDIKSLID